MRKSVLRLSLALVAMAGFLGTSAQASDPWVVYDGDQGPGQGKHIVLVSGDEEYRSEEALPMLGKILAKHHGFRCTVLFSINPEDGTIDPNNQVNIPGLFHLDQADLLIISTRFRELPDSEMKHIVQFVESGKPVLGLRTATHAFAYKRNRESPYARYSYNSGEWKGGFGQQVLGETWINHHGHHGRESTRGIENPEFKNHPVLRGVRDIWGPTDVYGVKNLTSDAHVLVHGQVIDGMKPTDPPVDGKKNDPMMPLAWVKEFTGEAGTPARVFCTTMGSSVDLESEGFRRLLVNASYWGLHMEEKIREQSCVDLVGTYRPSPFGFNKFQRGVKPSDHAL